MARPQLRDECHCKAVSAWECIVDQEELTQWGGSRFRQEARPDSPDYGELSMVRGRMEGREAYQLSTGKTRTTVPARHFDVGQLRARGFDVVHTPSSSNRQHVSVVRRSGATSIERVWTSSL